MNYDGVTEDRYIVLPGQTRSREIELSCAIRPGALRDQYSVQWIQANPNKIIDTNQFELLQSINASSQFQYHCEVTIQHNTAIERVYNGPRINIQTNGKV